MIIIYVWILILSEQTTDVTPDRSLSEINWSVKTSCSSLVKV